MGSRSRWKGPFVDPKLKKVVYSIAGSGGKNSVIKTWSRRSTVLPKFVGLTFSIHNGKKFIPVVITPEMVGMKLGQFAPTRTYNGHAANKKAKRS